MSSDHAPVSSEPRRAWPVIHIVLRSLLGAALVVMLVVIVLRTVGPGAQGSTVAGTSASPSATAEPIATPSPTSTPLPTPTTTTPSDVGTGGGTGGTGGSGTDGGGTDATTAAPVISSFVGPATIECPAPSEAPVPGVGAAETPYVSFTWTGAGADTAYFGIGTADAELAPYSSVGVNDSISVDFQCSNSNVTYAITMIGPGGKTSKTLNVVNTGYVG